jgi:TrmH family RNA methyltransferase
MKALNDVRVVLVESKFSGNIGLVARVMKNLGFSDLRLVRPRAELNKEAYARAAHAAEIIDLSKISSNLLEAVSDCGLVIGTSRRYAARKKNIIGMEDLPALLRPALGKNKIAIVFGSEDCGLAGEDARLCHFMAGIRPGTEYDVFSVSHAAAIMLWEINRIAREPAHKERELASASDMEELYSRLEQFLVEIDFIEPGDPRGMMPGFRGLFNRAMLSPREASMLRGVMRKVKWRINSSKKSPLKSPP